MTREEAIEAVKHLRFTVATDLDDFAYDDTLVLLEAGVPMREVRAYAMTAREVMTSTLVRLAYLNIAMILGRVRE
jgi:hypothetical protein